MANPFMKSWKCIKATINAKIDEHADPRVLIQQAVDASQRQYQALTHQAAQVIGNQRRLQMQLNRQIEAVEKLHGMIRQALVLAKKAAEAGDTVKAAEYDTSAEAFAARLVQAEDYAESLKCMHDQALLVANEAKKAVELSAVSLQKKLDERTRLLSQLEQVQLQEQISASLRSMSEITTPGIRSTVQVQRLETTSAAPANQRLAQINGAKADDNIIDAEVVVESVDLRK